MKNNNQKLSKILFYFLFKKSIDLLNKKTIGTEIIVYKIDDKQIENMVLKNSIKFQFELLNAMSIKVKGTKTKAKIVAANVFESR